MYIDMGNSIVKLRLIHQNPGISRVDVASDKHTLTARDDQLLWCGNTRIEFAKIQGMGVYMHIRGNFARRSAAIAIRSWWPHCRVLSGIATPTRSYTRSRSATQSYIWPDECLHETLNCFLW